jgi:hypothetical protein
MENFEFSHVFFRIFSDINRDRSVFFMEMQESFVSGSKLILLCYLDGFISLEGKSNLTTGLDRPIGFQAPRFQDNQHIKVVRLSAPVAFTPRNYSWYSFLLQTE